MERSIKPFQRIRLRLSLASRLVAVQLVVTLVIAMAVGGISYWLILKTLEDSQCDQLCADAAALSSITHRFIESHADRLQQIADSKALDKYFHSFNELALLSYFEDFDRYFEWISYANGSGIEEIKRNRQGRPMELENISMTPLFVKASADRGRIHIADSMDRSDGEPGIRLGKHIVSYFGECLGYVTAQVPLADFHQNVMQFPIDRDVHTFVVDRGGQILHDSQTICIGQNLRSMCRETKDLWRDRP